jgi:hypothetical protein
MRGLRRPRRAEWQAPSARSPKSATTARTGCVARGARSGTRRFPPDGKTRRGDSSPTKTVCPDARSRRARRGGYPRALWHTSGKTILSWNARICSRFDCSLSHACSNKR